MSSVLVVEDDEFTVRLITLKMQQLGFTVDVASNGQVGLERLLTLKPDLVLLDLMLPGMSGIDVCRHARATSQGRSVPIIMLTAKAQERDVEAGFAAGATDYLCKPFSPRELQVRVRAVMERMALDNGTAATRDRDMTC